MEATVKDEPVTPPAKRLCLNQQLHAAKAEITSPTNGAGALVDPASEVLDGGTSSTPPPPQAGTAPPPQAVTAKQKWKANLKSNPSRL